MGMKERIEEKMWADSMGIKGNLTWLGLNSCELELNKQPFPSKENIFSINTSTPKTPYERPFAPLAPLSLFTTSLCLLTIWPGLGAR